MIHRSFVFVHYKYNISDKRYKYNNNIPYTASVFVSFQLLRLLSSFGLAINQYSLRSVAMKKEFMTRPDVLQCFVRDLPI